jgi:hypothetical protein
LDIDATPKKPKYIYLCSYEHAEDFPLILYDCVYRDLDFVCLDSEIVKTYDHLYVNFL